MFVNYHKRFVRLANTYVRDSFVAEDITGDAFMYCWEHRHALASDLNIPAYIFTAIKHKCLNYLQGLRVRGAASDNLKNHAEWELNMRIATLEACEPGELFAREIQEIVENTLNAMSEQTRKIFVMSRYDNLSYKEIAAHFGITVKGVEFHISKALKQLHNNLKDYSILYFWLVLQFPCFPHCTP